MRFRRDTMDDDWLDDETFDRHAAAERAERSALNRAAFDRNLQAMADQDAATRDRVRQFTLDANVAAWAGEYAAAGVRPKLVDDKGRPRESLSMLLYLGWTIQEVEGRNVLIAPEGGR